MIVLPPGVSEECFQLAAIDDEIVESDEMFRLIIETLHPNDVVNGNTSVVIQDNDCKHSNNNYACHCNNSEDL